MNGSYEIIEKSMRNREICSSGNVNLRRQLDSFFIAAQEYWSRNMQVVKLKRIATNLKPRVFHVQEKDSEMFTLRDKAILGVLYDKYRLEKKSATWNRFWDECLLDADFFRKLLRDECKWCEHIETVINNVDCFLKHSETSMDTCEKWLQQLKENITPQLIEIPVCVDNILTREATDEIVFWLDQNNEWGDINLMFYIGEIRPALYDREIHNFKQSKKTPRKTLVFSEPCTDYSSILNNINSILYKYTLHTAQDVIDNRKKQCELKKGKSVECLLEINKLLVDANREWILLSEKELQDAKYQATILK